MMQKLILRVKGLLKYLLRIEASRILRYFRSDARRFLKYSGCCRPDSQSAIETRIIMRYHVLEKGLTMRDRHIPFGKAIASSLIDLIDKYEQHYGGISRQCQHAIGVVSEYARVHKEYNSAIEDVEFWVKINAFLSRHSEIKEASQKRYSKKDFFFAREHSFYDFAMSRHTVRNYSLNRLPIQRIMKSVKLAMTAPSACNRQQIRVKCVSNKVLCARILEQQGGNRGFGHLADKVLVVTADLCAEMDGRERNDAYINGGMFLMNLCYSLHYYEIAHCVLTWAVDLTKDRWLRSVCSIPENEIVVALLCCGEAADEFDVACSPRRELCEVFSEVGPAAV